jgi:hypothetical protein
MQTSKSVQACVIVIVRYIHFQRKAAIENTSNAINKTIGARKSTLLYDRQENQIPYWHYLQKIVPIWM